MTHPGKMVIGAGLILFSIGTVAAQTRPLTGSSTFQSAGYGAYPFSGSNDPKICLTRTSNGIRECRTRDEWTRIAHRLSKKQRGG